MQNRLIIIILIIILFPFVSSGQKKINSPYARFNLGAMEPAGTFRSLGMGGASTALRSNTNVYFSNPASYSSFDTTSFIFDFGMDYSRNWISDGISSYMSDDFDFDHVAMGFPISKKWGIGAGIYPYTSGYYNIVENGLDEVTGQNYESAHTGDGSFSTFFVGTGLSVTKNLSLGINMTFLFGEINRLYKLSFTDDLYIDDLYIFSNNAAEKLQLSGMNFDYGLHYTATLKKKYFFVAGVSVTPGKYYSTSYGNLAFKSLSIGLRDTINYVADDTTSTFIPGTLKAGISFGKKDKYTVGIDFITSKWSESRIPGSNGYTADTKSLLFGIEYTPDKFSNYSFVKRIDYRIGGHVADNYLILHEQQIREYGASIGLGIPLRRTFSKTNIYVDFTRKSGSPAEGLKYEDYLTAGISLNFYDYWFIKRKYD